MKDFNELLDDQKDRKISHFKSHINSGKSHHENISMQPQTYLEKAKKYLVKYGGPLSLCLLTGPFNTASILLQIADKPVINELQKKIDFLGKEDRYAKNGIYGDNKIYKATQITGYNDCFTRLGKEGIKGMYKGNLSALILTLTNTKLRTELYNETSQIINISEEWKKNLITVATCSLADFITLPIMLCQSRLVFQSSLSNFRTYKNPIQVLQRTSAKMWFAGSSLLLIKNILFSYSWLTFIKQSPVYSFILSTVLSHVLVYPFITAIRQVQCNDLNTAMMHNRQQKMRQCIKRIWNTGGIRGFYRGFMGYALVHSFLGIIIVDMNIRKGYFDQLSH